MLIKVDNNNDSWNYVLVLLILTSCGGSSVVNKNHKDMDEIKVTDQIAIVDYWKEIDRYTFSFSIPNTIDQKITAIVETSMVIPESLKKPGEKIIFSGKISQKSKQPPPRMGGEKIYTLIELSNLKNFKQ
jgi:hypothetical protein